MSDRTAPSAIAIEPIRSTRYSEGVILRIARMVEEGSLKLNDRLPTERDLQVRWQVSRPVLREAFRILEAQGVVESRPGGGRFLRSTRVLDPLRSTTDELAANRDILERIWEAREAVEVKLAELAALRATDADLAAIGRPLSLIGELPRERLATLDLNGDFHTAIARAARNPLLEEMIERLLRASAQVGFKRIVGLQDWAALQGEHQPIFDAIRKRQPQAAREAMRRHFDNLRRRVELSAGR
jgi:GntR family transcriptional repressor for pyruvate dehydrogenase complex